jgi:Zn-dependent protease with chaperone function
VTPLVLGLLGLALAGPVPALLGRSGWLLSVPRAGVVLWQSLALAASLAVLGAGLSVAMSLGIDGNSPVRMGAAVVVLVLTAVILARLLWSTGRVALDTRARRRRHRDLVDLLGSRSGDRPDLRILEQEAPMAYCVPALGNNRLVLSEGALACLGEPELMAVLAHEQAHVRARHDLVLEGFSSLHEAFPRGVRSEVPLHQAQVMVEMLADDAARSRVGAAPLARALVSLAGQCTPAAGLGAADRSVLVRLERLAAPVRPRRLRSAVTYAGAAMVLVAPTVLVAVPWLMHAREVLGA